MGTRDLAARYGRSNSKTLINRAIRAELIGGEELLDALDCLERLTRKFEHRDWHRQYDASLRALREVQPLISEARAEIRRRYGMPPESVNPPVRKNGDPEASGSTEIKSV